MKTDLEIQSDVIDELKWESYIKSSDIGVSVHDGVVTLTGIVDSYSKKRLAESVAMRIDGVKGIAEDIIVRFDTDQKITDPEITQMIVKTLNWYNVVLQEKVIVKVEDGWVTLSGEVKWSYEKKAIERAIENNIGVKGITNLISIHPHVKMDINNIKGKIMSAFQRNACINANNIVISSIRNTIILRGLVESNAEKQEAERVAWNAPGVLLVDNRLEVAPLYIEKLN